MTRTLEVVMTPALLPLYEVKGRTVVVIDILRATTSICEAFNSGAEKILPVSTPEECALFRDFDFLCAAERNALKVEGFDLGNSPVEFRNPLLRDRKIAFTTTNGTKAIRLSRELGAGEIVIGAFLNLSAVCDHLAAGSNSVLLLCAGWKDKFNLEDFLYAGAVVEAVSAHFDIDCDSAIAAERAWQGAKHELEKVVRQSSHAKRFTHLHAEHDDVAHSLQIDSMRILPMLIGEYIMLAG